MKNRKYAMSSRNTYLEKQIRTKYVPNGVFREANMFMVRTSVNTYQIRTKYVLRISIFVAYLRFEMGKIRTAYFIWASAESIRIQRGVYPL